MKKTLALVILSVLFCTGYCYDSGKNPVKAMFLSFTIPGSGQFYNEKYVKAGVIFTLQTTFLGLSIHSHNRMNKYYDKALQASGEDFYYYERRYFEYYDRRQNMLWWFASAVVLSGIDAFVDASLFNFEQEKRNMEVLFDGDIISVNFRF